MEKYFSIRCPRAPAALIVALGPFVTLPAHAQSEAPVRNRYVGVFGGVAQSDGRAMQQLGTAHRRAAFALPGFRDFDLKVDVEGKTAPHADALIGIQFGYRIDDGHRKLIPALEVEALHVSSRQQAALTNRADEVVADIGAGQGQDQLLDPRPLVHEEYGAGKHRFDDRMQAASNLLVANAVVGYRLSPALEPYVGAGLGFAVVTMRKAQSFQTNPSGPIEQTSDTREDVNHFNSDTSSTSLAFAVQGKAGLRMSLSKRTQLFAEYRYVRVSAAQYSFGETAYTGHAPTERWMVRSGPATLHAGLVGVRVSL